MTWSPISNTVPQYQASNGSLASGYYLKFYNDGTTTPINMATDSTGGTTLAKCQLNASGYPINGSSAVFIPHIDQTYKLALYTNATDADNDTTANAVWIVDALQTPQTSGDLQSTALDDGTKGFHLVYHPLTSEEQSAGITPLNYEYPYLHADRYSTLQDLFDAAVDNSTIEFGHGTTYTTTSAITIPVALMSCVIQGNGAVINANHTGHAIVMIATNQNYSRNKFYNLTIQGPNVSYPTTPAELTGTSTGAALKIGRDDTSNTVAAYLCSFINCRFEKFKYGVYMQAALLCEFIGGAAVFNQYGVYIDGGQTNANTFSAFVVRENRIAGIYSSGRTGGSLTNATHNVFNACEIETNIPYDVATYGGYPTAFDSSGVGVGAYLLNSYDFIFNSCYFENHNYSIWLGSSSDDNKFHSCRLASGGTAEVRAAGVILDGTAVNNNVFSDCKILSGSGVGTFISNSATQYYNQLIDCVGFFLDPSIILSWPFIRNLRKTQGTSDGTIYGATVMPPQGYKSNPIEGTTQGTIAGIGTATATLYAFGFSEIQFGSQITAATTITTINDSGSKGKILVLTNYQVAYSVTIKSGLNGYDPIVLAGKTDAVMSNYGDMLVLYGSSIGGKYFEIGRNF